MCIIPRGDYNQFYRPRRRHQLAGVFVTLQKEAAPLRATSSTRTTSTTCRPRPYTRTHFFAPIYNINNRVHFFPCTWFFFTCFYFFDHALFFIVNFEQKLIKIETIILERERATNNVNTHTFWRYRLY